MRKIHQERIPAPMNISPLRAGAHESTTATAEPVADNGSPRTGDQFGVIVDNNEAEKKAEDAMWKEFVAG